MNRRNDPEAMAVALPAGGESAAAPPPIKLHCDLELNPASEKEMLETYNKVFRPAITKQPGFVSVRLLKLRAAKQGNAPANCPYRLVISFQTEEQRLTWVATDLHQTAWGAMEKTLRGSLFTALLYDPVD